MSKVTKDDKLLSERMDFVHISGHRKSFFLNR